MGCILLCTGHNEEDLLHRKEEGGLMQVTIRLFATGPLCWGWLFRTSLLHKAMVWWKRVPSQWSQCTWRRCDGWAGDDWGVHFCSLGSTRWLLENDVSCTIYLLKEVQKEEEHGTFNPHGQSKDSLLSFLNYSRSLQEIVDLRKYLHSRETAPPVDSEGDNIVGFCVRAKNIWRQVWEGRTDGYAVFIIRGKCVPNRKNVQVAAVHAQAGVQFNISLHCISCLHTNTEHPWCVFEYIIVFILCEYYKIQKSPSTGFSLWLKDSVFNRTFLVLSPSLLFCCVFFFVLACSDVCLLPLFSH